ncbi:MAG: ADP-forming succinate--CoA ligase subunit beta [Planctomycetes bacterium]|nr:ADP-forming succinate--CoA ligase subunit beta [Planctomycetota bacterium]
MKIHEFQAKEILRRHGVPTPRGRIARTPEEAGQIAGELGGEVSVVKAQIHAGGRGKGGGIRLARSAAEAAAHARAMLGMPLVTHQTGPAGRTVRKVLVEEGLDIDREFYLAVTLDRAAAAPVVIASLDGGVEIEKVAAERPDAIRKVWADPLLGLSPFRARRLAFGLGLEGKTAGRFAGFVTALFEAFLTNDGSLAEINPLVLTRAGDLLALDAKMTFDDNALFRHPDLRALRDLDEEDPLETEASRHDLSYIKLAGSVGCMVNGAGLAMATMDIIKLAGAMPANFLDVGGGTDPGKVASAFRILTSDADVQAVLINIFGGIVRCDRVAAGVIQALQSVRLRVPVVVRLEGTNAREAARMLEESTLEFVVAQGMEDAAEKVVAALPRRAPEGEAR